MLYLDNFMIKRQDYTQEKMCLWVKYFVKPYLIFCF